jgi:hypothetical protein
VWWKSPAFKQKAHCETEARAIRGTLQQRNDLPTFASNCC